MSKSIEDVRHRIKRLHELGDNYEYFKTGDIYCEFLLSIIDDINCIQFTDVPKPVDPVKRCNCE